MSTVGARVRTGGPRAQTWLRFPQDRAFRTAVVLLLLAGVFLPLAQLRVASLVGNSVIYASFLATGCGLVALLLFEDQLLGGSDLRLLGLAGTFLTLMAIGIMLAAAGGLDAVLQTTAGPVSGRLLWHVALGLGLALSLATPSPVWHKLTVGDRWTALSYAGVIAMIAVVVLVLSVVVSGIMATGIPTQRLADLSGPGAALGWSTFGLGAALVVLAASRWRHLNPMERWMLPGAGAAMLGLLIAMVGGSVATMGAQLGPAETGTGLMITIIVLAARLHSGDHQLLLLELSERRALREVATQVHSGETVDQTAHRICREFVRLRGTAIAQIISLAEAGVAIPVASYPHTPVGFPAVNYQVLPNDRNEYLRRRAASGPWIERCAEAARATDDPAVRDYWTAYTNCGLHAFAYAPIRQGSRVLGLLVTAAADRDPDSAARHLIEILPSLADFATSGATNLGPLLNSPGASAGGVELVLRALDEGSFRPVFQPIVEVESKKVVGWEALTRFSGGLTPDRAFAIADEHGLLERLEIATLTRAIHDSANVVEAGQFLSLNLSPEVLVDSQEQLARRLSQLHDPVVVEITEHQVVSDYEAVRQAVRRLGPRTRLAVDDAGAGYASLRHILELQPDFVKLDISLVQGMSGDAAREAMVAGIQHFASKSQCILIAEGVETEGERSQLIKLGVPLAQGYLFARPRPVAVGRRSA